MLTDTVGGTLEGANGVAWTVTGTRGGGATTGSGRSGAAEKVGRWHLVVHAVAIIWQQRVGLRQSRPVDRWLGGDGRAAGVDPFANGFAPAFLARCAQLRLPPLPSPEQNHRHTPKAASSGAAAFHDTAHTIPQFAQPAPCAFLYGSQRGRPWGVPVRTYGISETAAAVGFSWSPFHVNPTFFSTTFRSKCRSLLFSLIFFP